MKAVSLGLMLAAGLALAACDVRVPSQVNVEKIQVRDAIKTQAIPMQGLAWPQIRAIADDYLRNGTGQPLSLVVTYAQGNKNAERAAIKSAKRIQGMFADRGVKGANVGTVPVTVENRAGQMIVSYRAWVAEAPKECTGMPGSQGGVSVEEVKPYRVGCDTQEAIARQVARPRDLLGTSGMDDSDSRRQGTIVEPYKAGTPNEPLKGMAASDVGG